MPRAGKREHTGTPGVYSYRGRFSAVVMLPGRRQRWRTFDTFEEAVRFRTAHERQRRKTRGSIYVLQAAGGGPVKIGFSRSGVQSRRAACQTGHAEELQVLYSVGRPQTYETLLHNFFVAQRVRGEWFSVTADEVREAVVLLDRFFG